MKAFNNYLLLIFFSVLLVCTTQTAYSQGGQRVIQLSGIILGEDSVSGVPGVHIYVPKAGRGTTSNLYGYFSMPALVGDSVVISSVGFMRQHIIVPGDQGESITAVIELRPDTTVLQEITIFPYPTEELFKEAILALQLPEERQFDLNALYGDEAMAQMLRNTPYDGALNFRYYQDQQFNAVHNRFGYVQNPLLNPFNWAKFINSLKKKKDD